MLRGWIVAQLLCGIGSNYPWRGFIPNAGNSQLGGVVITVAAIIVSIWLGRWSLRFSPWPRALMAAASLAVAVWAITVLADNMSGGGGSAYVVVPAISATPGDPQPSGIPIYGSNGNLIGGPVPAARSAPPTATVPTPTTTDSAAPAPTG